MTTADRRLDKVEASLSPTALVLRWLSEAHGHDSFTAYTRSLVEVEWPEFPLDRLAQAAKANATQHVRGLPREEAEATINRSIVETVFRVQLVLRINVIAQEFLDREALIQGVLSAYLALALTADEGPQERAILSVPTIRDLLFGRVAELHALQTAREQLAARYLETAQALFPAGLRAWDGQRHASEREAVIADRLAELDGCEPAPPDDPGATDARVAQLVADHVDPARSNAYDQIGDGRRALAVAVRWLRPKLLDDDPQITRR